MKPLSEKEFKEYVIKKAKEYIFDTTDNLKVSAINENAPDGLDQVMSKVQAMYADKPYIIDLFKAKAAGVDLTKITQPEYATLYPSANKTFQGKPAQYPMVYFRNAYSKIGPMNESVVDDTLDSVKSLVSDMKKMNSSLSFREPILESAEPKAPDVDPEPERKFHVGSYENVSIDLKETLNETMNHYNRQKNLKHGKQEQTKAWDRLTNYKKYSED